MSFTELVAQCCHDETGDCFAWLVRDHRFQVIIDPDTFRRFAIRVGTVPVVGVCHLDTVSGYRRSSFDRESGCLVTPKGAAPLVDESLQVIPITSTTDGSHWSINDIPPDVGETVLQTIRLDDRLGLAGLLRIAETHDITIVCCDQEETGQTTGTEAASFIAANDIPCNWLFELDRRGLNPATYQYSSEGWDDIIMRHYAASGRLEYGSFSDISSMESIGRKAVNFGIGYHHEHSMECFAWLSHVESVLCLVSSMLTDLSSIPFEHVPEPLQTSHWDNPRDEWEAWEAEDTLAEIQDTFSLGSLKCVYCADRPIALLDIQGCLEPFCRDCLLDELVPLRHG
jgi:hypothetical protein